MASALKARRELRVSVSEEKPDWMRSLSEPLSQVSCLLDYPCCDRVGGDPVRCTRRVSSSMKKST